MFSTYVAALVVACLASVSQGETGSPFLIVSLSKQDVPVIRKNHTIVNKTAYYGNISAGSPAKQFSIVFDTGSGHIILPSLTCRTPSCMQHTQFDSILSPGRIRKYKTPSISVVFGTGQVEGRMSDQPLCFPDPVQVAGNKTEEGQFGAHEFCFQGSILLAHEMSETPFGDFLFDGVLGLGLPALAVSPEYSIWNMWSVQVVGLFISDIEGVSSELALGGHDTARQAGKMHWVQLHQPGLGYWQVRLEGLTIGGVEFEGCADGGCTAIIDSGTSHLGVPRSLGKDIFNKLSWRVADPTTDCRESAGPEFAFRLPGLEGSVNLSLSRREYARSSPLQGYMCSAALLPMPQIDASMSDRVFILGEPMLRKYYTAYAASEKRIGFAASAKGPMITL